MNVRFYIDPETMQPHIEGHHVTEQEALDVLRKPLEETRGTRSRVISVGQSRGGRYLRVISSPDESGDGIFVIMAFDLPARQILALKRRLRRRGR